MSQDSERRPRRDLLPSRARLEARVRMNRAIRGFFEARGFLEVETPIAVPSPGVELHLQPFETTRSEPGQPPEQLYLHTSPEYAMKRMIRRLGHIFQLARVFRNGERSDTHAPEFTMLEFYRCPGGWRELVDDVYGVIQAVAAAVDGPWRPARLQLRSVSELFVEAGLVDPLEHPDRESLRAGLRVRSAPDDSWEDLFHRAFFEHVEPQLSPEAVTVVHGYPAQLAALSRLDPEDPRRAERFEVYVGRLELGNAYGELVDVEALRGVLLKDIEQRARLGLGRLPLDEAMLADLAGAPPSAGIAIGVDRLLMCCLQISRIQELLVFSPEG